MHRKHFSKKIDNLPRRRAAYLFGLSVLTLLTVSAWLPDQFFSWQTEYRTGLTVLTSVYAFVWGVSHLTPFGGSSAVLGWHQVNPDLTLDDAYGKSINLHDVQVISDNVVVAIGDWGVILRTEDFGLTWTQQDSGVSLHLHGLSFENENSGIVVGKGGVVLRTTNGGATWSNVSAGLFTKIGYTLPEYSAYCLYAVHHTGNNVAVAVGGGGVAHAGQFMLRSTDGGVTWNDISEWTLSKQLRDIKFNSRGNGIAVGGIVDDWPRPHLDLLYSEDRGASWTVTSSLSTPELEHTFPHNAVAFADPDNAFAVYSKDYFLETLNAGENWLVREELAPDCGWINFSDIDFGDSQVGYIVGQYGTILRTPDVAGMMNWQQLLPRPTRVQLEAVSFLNPLRGAIVAGGNTKLLTTDGGNTWNGTASLTMSDLQAVSFVDTLNGMAVGESGSIFRTLDGGLTWDSLNVADIQFPFKAISMVDTDTAFIVDGGFRGGRIYATTNGGDTWRPLFLPETPSGEYAPWLRDVSFLDAQNGIATTSNSIIRTTDGGSTWTRILNTPTTDGLRGIHYASATMAIIVGYNRTILKSTNGGATWTQVATENIGVTSPANLLSVHMLNNSEGWAVGWKPYPDNPDNELLSEEGIILHTTDGGNTWSRQISGTEHVLRDVHFINANVGTIVGGYGDSNSTPIVQDGIVLHTSDGATWYEQPTQAKANLHSVHLLSAQNGIIVGGKGVILHTSTAGDT